MKGYSLSVRLALVLACAVATVGGHQPAAAGALLTQSSEPTGRALPQTNQAAAATNDAAIPERVLHHPPLTPGPEDGLISQFVASILERAHYLQRPFDKEISAKFFDQYLDTLDPQHLLLLQSDVADFHKYRSILNTLTMRDRDTSPAEAIFNRFMERIDQQVLFVNAFLKTNVFKFDLDERYPLSRRTAPRPGNLAEAQHLWGDRLRFEYLQEELNDEKPAEILKIILRRYARMQRYLKEYDHSDVLQYYLTALAHVYDPHSDYMGKATMDNFNIGMRLSLTGIGALLRSEDGMCIIQELTPNGPAEKSGKLKPNDKIIAVAQGQQEPVEVVDMKLTKVVDLIRGPRGTEVRLTVIPANADPSVRKTVVLIRDEVKLEQHEAKARIIDLPSAAKRRLGIIDLASFYEEQPTATKTNHLKRASTDVSRLLKKLGQEKVDGVILDLRRNGGGSLEEAIRLTGLFIKKGPVVQVKDFRGQIIVDEDPDPSVQYDGPLLVLTSRNSASASEILAGALQDYGRALIVGDASTHGKGTVQQLLALEPMISPYRKLKEDPGALKITVRKFYLPKGASTQLRGVTPDIVLPSLNNFAEIGEATLPNALSWDTLPSTKFDPVNRIQPYLPELRKRSQERVAKDKDFLYVQQEIQYNRRTVEEKWVSLNEQQRRAEKQAAEARLKVYKQYLRQRPDAGEVNYEIKLGQVDLPGLPPPLPKTNSLKLTTAIPGEGHPGSLVFFSPSVEKPATNLLGQPSSARGDPAATNRLDNPGEPLPKTDSDDVPLVDVDLLESERILTDLIELSKQNASPDGAVSLSQ